MFPALATSFALGYLLGSIPFGLLIAFSRGVDIRTVGSGNIGASNVYRIVGKKWGLLTFLCDFLKGLVAVLIAQWLLAPWIARATVDDVHYVGVTTAIGCIIGHSFPIWLRFKGGKGVATSLGAIAAAMPLASISIFTVWVVVLKLSRYISLASILAALSLPVFVAIYLLIGWMHGWVAFYFAVVATTLVVAKHTSNIRRLLAGTEPRTRPRASTAAEPPAQA